MILNWAWPDSQPLTFYLRSTNSTDLQDRVLVPCPWTCLVLSRWVYFSEEQELCVLNWIKYLDPQLCLLPCFDHIILAFVSGLVLRTQTLSSNIITCPIITIMYWSHLSSNFLTRIFYSPFVASEAWLFDTWAVFFFPKWLSVRWFKDTDSTERNGGAFLKIKPVSPQWCVGAQKAFKGKFLEDRHLRNKHDYTQLTQGGDF